MDASISAALTTGLGDFATGAVDQIVAVLPVALPVVIGIAVMFLGIRLFRGVAHV